MFDKDDNEINWTPTQNLGDKVIFYNQAYINEQTKRLEQENKELKEENVKLLFGKGALIKLCDNLTKIIDEKKEKESKLWQALEEIREVLKFYADTWVDEKIYPNLHYDNTKAKEGLSRINEVLNDRRNNY